MNMMDIERALRMSGMTSAANRLDIRPDCVSHAESRRPRVVAQKTLPL